MISRFAKAFYLVVLTILVVSMLAFINPRSRAYMDPATAQLFSEDSVVFNASNADLPMDSGLEIAKGPVIMPHLGNATAKAALGRATWKLLHTMTLRYPKNPTRAERDALESYFHLTSRLYPCGECAQHFQKMLKEYPPQTSSRRAAALWLCSLHNLVNIRLEKPVFDCNDLDAEYDCGCGDPPIGKQTDLPQIAG